VFNSSLKTCVVIDEFKESKLLDVYSMVEKDKMSD